MRRGYAPPSDEPNHAGQFRWDGGFDKGPNDALVAAWGAAWWDVDASNADPPDATASGVLADPATSNMAEFTGLRACLRRALRHPRPRLVFEHYSTKDRPTPRINLPTPSFFYFFTPLFLSVRAPRSHPPGLPFTRTL